MEPSKKTRKPFKLQSLLKLNTRIVEKDLRSIAAELACAINNAQQTILDVADIKDDDTKVTKVLEALANNSMEIVKVLQLVTTTGARQWDIVHTQKALTYKSEQPELEKLFKLITATHEDMKASMVKGIQERAKQDGKTQCDCMACQMKRAMEKAGAKVKTTTKDSTKPTSVIKEATLVKLEVKDGASVADVFAEAISKIKSGEIK